jgi:hypothetical protein
VGYRLLPEHIPWLDEIPTGGTLVPGDCQNVDFVYDATGMPPGTYAEDVDLLTNDPLVPVMTLPVTMTVFGPTAIDSVTWMTYTDSCQVDFDATAMGGSGNTTFIWDFGDGFGDVGPSVSHTYAIPGGIFTVTLTVDDCGTAEWEESITVSCSPPATFYYLPIVIKH